MVNRLTTQKNKKKTYCWNCHKDVKDSIPGYVKCKDCPRSYHKKCSKKLIELTADGQCPQCVDISNSRNIGHDIGKVREALTRYVLSLVRDPQFLDAFGLREEDNDSDYGDFVANPLNLIELKDKVMNNVYSSAAGFLADIKLILHNCHIYYGRPEFADKEVAATKIEIAETLLSVATEACKSIDKCPQCCSIFYDLNNSYADYFAIPCDPPHNVVMVKYYDGIYFPAKTIQYVPNQKLFVYYFGGHQESTVEVKNVKHVTKDFCDHQFERKTLDKLQNRLKNAKTDKQREKAQNEIKDFRKSMNEMKQYLKNLGQRFSFHEKGQDKSVKMHEIFIRDKPEEDNNESPTNDPNYHKLPYFVYNEVDKICQFQCIHDDCDVVKSNQKAIHDHIKDEHYISVDGKDADTSSGAETEIDESDIDCDTANDSEEEGQVSSTDHSLVNHSSSNLNDHTIASSSHISREPIGRKRTSADSMTTIEETLNDSLDDTSVGSSNDFNFVPIPSKKSKFIPSDEHSMLTDKEFNYEPNFKPFEKNADSVADLKPITGNEYDLNYGIKSGGLLKVAKDEKDFKLSPPKSWSIGGIPVIDLTDDKTSISIKNEPII